MYLFLIIGICVVLWFFAARKPKMSPSKQASGMPVTPGKLSWEDEMAASLEHLRRAVQEKARAEAQPLQVQIEDAQNRLRAARSTADKLGVTDATTAIADEMKHWHKWKSNPNFDLEKERLVEGLIYIGGDSSTGKNGDNNTNEFTFRGRRYRLSILNDHHGWWEQTYRNAELTLEVFEGDNAMPVFKAELSKDISEEPAYWRVLHVTMLNAGEWIHEIVLLNELFKLHKEKQLLRQKADYILPKASQI